jgi:hypothetical protein
MQSSILHHARVTLYISPAAAGKRYSNIVRIPWRIRRWSHRYEGTARAPREDICQMITTLSLWDLSCVGVRLRHLLRLVGVCWFVLEDGDLDWDDMLGMVTSSRLHVPIARHSRESQWRFVSRWLSERLVNFLIEFCFGLANLQSDINSPRSKNRIYLDLENFRKGMLSHLDWETTFSDFWQYH